MARDLNRVFEDMRNSREVYVTQDGRVESADEAEANATHEERREGAAKPRTRLKPEIFGSGGTVFVADSVVTQAHTLARRFAGETGAIGVGPDPLTITELIPSGPDAKRAPGSFELDAHYLQPLLEQAERRGLRFTAFWHSHPEGFAEPSVIDRRAARRMLTDTEWGLDGHLFLPISVRTRGGFSTRFFRAEGADARIREVTPVLISSPELAERSVAEAVGDPNWRLQRLRHDRVALGEAGWEVSIRDLGSRRALRLTEAGVTLWMGLPPEYPLSGPDVFVEERDALRPIPLGDTPELLAWSSLRSVVTVAEQAKKSVDDLRAVESLLVRPRGVSLIHRAAPVWQRLPFMGSKQP